MPLFVKMHIRKNNGTNSTTFNCNDILYLLIHVGKEEVKTIEIKLNVNITTPNRWLN